MNSGIPLYQAIKDDDIERVKLLLSQGVDINIRDNYGETPLFKAAQNGKTKIVKLLLDKGANPELSDGHNTPLLAAIEYFRFSNIDVISELANVATTENLKRALEVAKKRNNEKVIDLLTKGITEGGRRKKRKTNKKRKSSKRRKTIRKGRKRRC